MPQMLQEVEALALLLDQADGAHVTCEVATQVYSQVPEAEKHFHQQIYLG